MITQEADALIIGFGKGGKTLAPFLAKQGWRVIVVEQSPAMYGGTCINIGCIPTKSLVHGAEIAASRGDVEFAEKERAFEAAWRTKEELVSFLRGKNRDNVAGHPGIRLITGQASFVSPHEVIVTMQADEAVTIRADRIFINTGAVPAMPAVEGDSRRLYNSTTLLGLNKLPRRMAIVGSGFIGLEFASMYANFGTEVTVIERSPELLKREDADVREAVRQALEALGVRFMFSSRVERIHDDASAAVLSIRDEAGDSRSLEADVVLFATGRQPNTASLALERAGVRVTEKGFIAVDDTLRTNVPHIWAIGDVNGGPQFTYISLDDYRIIRNHLFGDGSRSRQDRRHVPISVFITPVFAKVGMTEEEAAKAGFRVKVAKLPLTASPRARILQQTIGFYKAVVDEETGRILGAALFGAEAGEIINVIALAMDTEQTYESLRDRIYTHPSMTETLNDLFAQL
ncbi:Pyruvate/2-oxoglutarate dehydrogenase complex, dihydrolipoamide dehydrogenase (E3) component [Paenibacillus sp. UNC496MF]|uniref:FAD-dependent oxidoreductase n=1 Tax=Paenibacillus sp. UNC496MF TaxID=1502753 RepID=UPI0008EB859D|nr:FAD-dependent oxidoreductase [Paenibacillus sp. UNC496MF]SFI41384.1 Pyruvate/2-oxoglutarate dehydrogenase complex, dihydrolipoamide dehydrogenase (E3) component [Paenibacillus sp. UNC496MF]